MSSIDERIVQMEFDNSLFDKNVESSIKALEKLNVALKMDGIDKNLSNISSSVNKMDFSKVESGIDSLQKRFSTLGIMTMTWTQDFARAIEGVVGNAIRSITSLPAKAIAQIRSGGWSRATNIDQARFKIEGLFKDDAEAWSKISKDIDYAVTDTAFGFDEAANAAAQLSASGVQMGDDMKHALLGISGVAAMTSSTYSEIAPIFTKVAGVGRLYATELNSLSFKGINAASTLADYLKKTGKDANATEASVHKMIQKGNIDFKTFADAMFDAFGLHAKEANKTFEGSLANMKAALSRFGQPMYQAYRQNMIPVFNAMKEAIKTFKGFFDDASETNKNGMGTFTALARVMESISRLASGGIKYVTENLGFAANLAGGLTNIFNWLADAIDRVSAVFNIFAPKAEESAEKTEEAVEKVETSLEEIDKLVDRIWSGEFGNGEVRFKAIDELLGVEGAGKAVQNRLNELAGNDFRYADAADLAALATTKEAESIEKAEDKIDSFSETKSKFVDTLMTVRDAITKAFGKEQRLAAIQWFLNGIQAIQSAFSVLGQIIGAFLEGAIKGILDIFGKVSGVFGTVTNAIFNAITAFGTWFNQVDAFGKLKRVFEDIFKVLSDAFGFLSDWVKVGFQSVGTVFGKIGDVVSDAGGKISAFFSSLRDTKGFRKLNGVFTNIKATFKGISDKAITGVTKFFGDLSSFKIKLPELDIQGVAEKAGEALGWLGTKIIQAKVSIKDFFKSVQTDAKNPLHGIYTYFSNLSAEGIIESVSTKLNSAKQTIVKFFTESGIAAHAQEVFNNAIGAIQQNAPLVFNGILDAFSSLGTKILEAKDKVLGLWESFKTSSVAQAIQNGIINSINWLLNIINNATNAVSNFFSTLFGEAEIAEGSPLKGVIDFFSNISFSGILESVGSKFKAAKDTVFSFFTDSGIASRAQTAFSNALSTIQEVARGVFKGIYDVIQFIVKVILGAKDKIVDLWKSFEDSEGNGLGSKIKTKLVAAFTAITDKISKAKDAIVEFFSSIKTDESNPLHKIYTWFSNLTLKGVIDSVSTKFKKAKSSVVKFFKETGIAAKVQGAFNKAITAVKENAPAVFKGFIGIFPKIGSAILGAKDKVVEFWKSFKETEAYQRIKDGLADAFSKIVEKVGDAGGKVGEFFKDLIEKASNFKLPEINAETISNAITTAIDWIRGKFDELRETLGNFPFAPGTIGDSALNAIYNILTSQTLEDAITTLIDLLEKLKDKIIEVVGIITEKLFGINLATEGPFAFIGAGINEISGIVSECSEEFDGFEVVTESVKKIIGKLWKTAQPIVTAIAGYKVGSAILSIIDGVKGLGGILKNGAGTLKEVKKSLSRISKAMAFRERAEGIKSIAIAIGILAASFFALGQLNWDQFKIAAAAIGLVTAAIAALMILSKVLFGGGGGGGEGNPLTALQTFQETVADFGKKLSAALKTWGIAAIILSFVIAIKTLVGAVKELGQLNGTVIAQGLLAVTGLTALIGAFTYLMMKFSQGDFNAGKGFGIALIIVGLAAAIHLMSSAVKKLGSLKPEQWVAGILGLTIIVAELGALMIVADKIDLKGIIPLVAIIAEVLLGILILSVIPADKLATIGTTLLKAFGGIAALTAALGYYEGKIKDVKGSKIAGSLLGIGLIIAEIMAGLWALSTIDSSQIDKFDPIADAILEVCAGIALVVAALGYFNNGKNDDGGLAEIGKAGDKFSWKDLIPKTTAGKIIAAIAGISIICAAIDAATDDAEGKGGTRLLERAAEVIEKYQEPLEKVGAAIGALFGGALKKFTETLLDKSPAQIIEGVKDDLANFPETMRGWIDGIGKFIDDAKEANAEGKFDITALEGMKTTMENMKDMVDIAVEIASQFFSANGTLDAIIGEDIESPYLAIGDIKIADWFAAWGDAFAQFVEAIGGTAIESGAVDQNVTRVTEMLENINSILTKANDLTEIDSASQKVEKLPGLASNLVKYSWSVMFLNTGAVEGTQHAADIINSIAEHAITNATASAQGINDFADVGSVLEQYSTDLPKYGSALVEFSKAAIGLLPYALAIPGIGVMAGIINAAAGQAIKAAENNFIEWIGDAENGKMITALGSLSDSLPGYGAALASFAQEMQGMQSYAGAVEGTENAVGIINSLAKAGVEVGAENLEAAVGDISALASYANDLPELAKAFVKYAWAIDHMKSGAVFKTWAASSIILSLSNAIPDLKSGFLDLVTNNNKMNNFSTALPLLGKAFVDFSNECVHFNEGQATRVIDSFEKIISITDMLASYGQNGFDTIDAGQQAVSMVQEAIHALAYTDLPEGDEMQAVIDFGEQIGQALLGGISEGSKSAEAEAGGEAKSALASILESMLGDSSALATDATMLAKGEELGSALVGAIQTGFTSKDGAAEEGTGQIGLIISAMFGNLANISKLVKPYGEPIAQEIVNSIQEGINLQSKTSIDLTEFISAIEEGLKFAEGAMMDSGESLASAIASGIRSNRWAASSAGSSLGSAAASGARGQWSNMYSAGVYVGAGFAAGIRSEVSAAITATTQMANSAVQNTKDKLKQNSPSRVFMDIGSGVVEGFVKGINDNRSFVVNATTGMALLSVGSATDTLDSGIEEMAKSASKSIAAAYAYINNVASQSLNSSPVITPVLDMSMLQNGMNYANGLWGLNGYNPFGYTNTMMPGTHNYINGMQATSDFVTQTELRGIRTDLKNLGEAITHMNMVLDSGTLVGQLTPGIDSQLGAISGLKERWA